jgi:hypothetical protein
VVEGARPRDLARLLGRPQDASTLLCPDPASMSLASHACLKGHHDDGLLGRRRRGRLRPVDAAAGRGRQLPARRRATSDDSSHVRRGVAEDIVEDERDRIRPGSSTRARRGGHVDRLVEGDPVGGVGLPTDDPLRRFGQRPEDPFAYIALSPGSRRTGVAAEPEGRRDVEYPLCGGGGGAALPVEHSGHALDAHPDPVGDVFHGRAVRGVGLTG